MNNHERPEIGVGFGLAMGHLTGILNESNMFSTDSEHESYDEYPHEYHPEPDYPINDIHLKSNRTHYNSDSI